LYSFIRRRGHSPEDAQDLTQAFLANLLAKNSLKDVGPQKGRFRSYLLASLKYFLADEWDKVRAKKRGGQATIISLDAWQAEERYAMEPVDRNDPERLFERRWALTLLERVLGQLEAEMKQSGKQAVWDELKACLLGDADSPPYAELTGRLGMSLSAIKMTVSRLRQRFGDLLRKEIAATVSAEWEVDAEMRYLLSVISR
jgi:RNA polymerase sigma-70 factor (ECF subfamily)